MKTKIFVTLVLVVCFITAGFFIYKPKIFGAGPQVYLDNKLLYTEVPPTIIKDRVMVPYRSITEGMGSSPSWDPSQRKITVYLNNLYTIMYINNPVMTYGVYSLDNNGSVVYNSSRTMTLEAPPTIVNDRTLVPLRALSEGLGATVTWDGNARIVYVSSPPTPTPAPTPSPTPSPSPSPTPTPTTTPPPIPTATVSPYMPTNFFEEISAKRAQLMYDNDERFVMLYYSSKDQDSRYSIGFIKDAADAARVKVYGVDMDSLFYPNLITDLNFIWNHIPRNQNNYSTLFFVNGKSDVLFFRKPSNRFATDDYFYQYLRKVQPSASPQPTPTPDYNQYWKEISRNTAVNMFEAGTRFVYICYLPSDTATKPLVDTIKRAAYETGVYVYATDCTSVNENLDWWGKTSYGGPINQYPIIFLANDNVNGTATFIRPANISLNAIKAAFEPFVGN